MGSCSFDPHFGQTIQALGPLFRSGYRCQKWYPILIYFQCAGHASYLSSHTPACVCAYFLLVALHISMWFMSIKKSSHGFLHEKYFSRLSKFFFLKKKFPFLFLLWLVLPGAIALIQLQEDIKKQLSAEGNYTEEELEAYMQSHKKLMTDSLWKLNVADIEATLSRVCQMVVLLVHRY